MEFAPLVSLHVGHDEDLRQGGCQGPGSQGAMPGAAQRWRQAVGCNGGLSSQDDAHPCTALRERCSFATSAAWCQSLH